MRRSYWLVSITLASILCIAAGRAFVFAQESSPAPDNANVDTIITMPPEIQPPVDEPSDLESQPPAEEPVVSDEPAPAEPLPPVRAAISGVHIEAILNDRNQPVLRLTADTINNISTSDLNAGLVSWALVPSWIDPNNNESLKPYLLEHNFGFTNDPANALIDDGQFVPDEATRVVIFRWQCVTDACDSTDDIAETLYVSDQPINYHRLPRAGAVGGMRAEIFTSSAQQRAFRLTAGHVADVPSTELTKGLVSWSFVPSTMNLNEYSPLSRYLLDHGYGFTNDPNNTLIDDGKTVPNQPSRIILFRWRCVTDSCDTLDDMVGPLFISNETVDFHAVDSGYTLPLTQF